MQSLRPNDDVCHLFRLQLSSQKEPSLPGYFTSFISVQTAEGETGKLNGQFNVYTFYMFEAVCQTIYSWSSVFLLVLKIGKSLFLICNQKVSNVDLVKF